MFMARYLRMSSDQPQLISHKRVALGPHHLQPGRTKHTISDSKGNRDFPPFVALEIASYPGEESCYLFHLCESGECADTWHQSLQEAVEQAESEFGVHESEWMDVNYPFGTGLR
jgi:hypothetical protein